jgi:uncharacterized protein YtpQ (UPF0354 family)
VGLLNKLFSKQPSKGDFAKLVKEALAKTGVTGMNYDEKGFSLKMSEKGNVIFLDNSYAKYCKADNHVRKILLEQICSSFAESKSEIPDEFALACPNLMPIVRDSSYLSLVELHCQASDLDISNIKCPFMVLVDGLSVVLAYDTDQSIQQVNQATLDRWRVSFGEALQVAIDNLRERTNPNLVTEEAPGVYLGRWDDSYESARILLTDLIYRLSVDGEPVVFLPNRNQFWVTGSRNAAGLKTVLKMGGETHFEPHPLSPNLYLLSDGKLNFYIPEDIPLRDEWFSLKRRREAVDYTQQKDSLDKIFKKDKTNIFVASYKIFRLDDGTEYSACVWSKGVDSLLPKTEKIFFVVDPKEKNYVSVQWAAAIPVVGHLMDEKSNLLPSRQRVRLFPSEGQLDELRQMTRA